jgi:hypothetical protein
MISKLDRFRDDDDSLVTFGIVVVFALMLAICVVAIVANVILTTSDVFQGRL